MNKKAFQNYGQNQSKLTILKDARSLEILHQAKVYGVEIFENESLASELLDLDIEEGFNKETYKAFLEVLHLCEEAISKAQMSS